MAFHFQIAGVGALVVGCAGHGSIYEPPSRNSGGMSLGMPACQGNACLWYNEGCSIGCDNCTGKGPSFADPADAQCDNPAEPTIAFEETSLRTYGLRWNETGSPVDWTKYHPWRYPGSAPVGDSCGVSGGWYNSGPVGSGGMASPGVPQGEDASNSPFAAKLLEQTVWVAGSVVEVAWGIAANHGGGYQYRLCPADSELTEECFQKTPLEFVGDEQWIQFGHGLDTNNRHGFKATTVSGKKVKPAGSMWRRNPVPACHSSTDVTSGGNRRNACDAPMFEPPLPGVWGDGLGHCEDSADLDHPCTPDDMERWYLDFGIVDKVRVPDLPEGDYVLGFRWDCEQSPQVWAQCADVKIKRSGKGTKAFSPTRGCTQCCADGGMCSNCTGCLNDKTGACAYCWNELPGYHLGLPAMTCLGNEGLYGQAREHWAGYKLDTPWSPGCPLCWAENACDAILREEEDDNTLVV